MSNNEKAAIQSWRYGVRLVLEFPADGHLPSATRGRLVTLVPAGPFHGRSYMQPRIYGRGRQGLLWRRGTVGPTAANRASPSIPVSPAVAGMATWNKGAAADIKPSNSGQPGGRLAAWLI